MRSGTRVILALATVALLGLADPASATYAQETGRTVSLGPGCGMVTLTFADGTDAATVANAVSPANALDSIWRLDNSTGSFAAYVAAAPAASDLASVDLLDAVYLCLSAAADVSMPAVSSHPSQTISTPLGSGCNAVGLSFADGTTPSQAGEAITPADVFQSMWRLDNATGSFQAYMAAAPEVSDLTSLGFLDAVFICTTGPGELTMPAVTEPAAGGVSGPPQDIRFVMEAAVPQVVDLSPDFVAIDEIFEPIGPPGPLYFYGILYGSQLALIAPLPETLMVVEFDLGLYDTVAHAETDMAAFTSVSEEEFRAELEPELEGSAGLEIGTLDIREIEPPESLGDEASWLRVTLQVRPVRSQELYLPAVFEFITIRRDRVLGQIGALWSPGPPGRKVTLENLATKMDTGIQEALPQLPAATD
jgi:hypothetical protein